MFMQARGRSAPGKMTGVKISASSAPAAKPPAKVKVETPAQALARAAREDWHKVGHALIRPAYRGQGFEYAKTPADPDEPLQWFELFFDDLMVARLVDETNKGPEWAAAPLTVDEYKAFMGCMMRLGLTCPPNIHDVWSDSDMTYGISFITDCFPRDRFLFILSNLHLHGPMTEPEREEARSKDKMYSMRWFIDDFNKHLCAMAVPGEWLVCDECLFPSRAHSGIRQYNQAKPNKWGIKVYCLCDVETGILLKTEVYQGAHTFADYSEQRDPSPDVSDAENSSDDDEDDDPTKLSESAAVVVNMVRPWMGIWRGVCSDNWFTSVPLATHLWSVKMKFVGTCRKGRAAFPSALQDWLKNNNRQRGDHLIVTQPDGIVNATAVHDTKNLALLDTATDGQTLDTCQRRKITKTDGKKGFSVKKFTVTIPESLALYQRTMRSVDTWDQLIHVYNLARITRSCWWRKLFWGFYVTSMVVVSWKYFNLYRSREGTTPLPLKEFQETLARDLVNGNTFRKSSNIPFSTLSAVKKVGGKRKQSGAQLPHRFAHVEVKETCASCSIRCRQLCVVCKVMVCKKCLNTHIKL